MKKIRKDAKKTCKDLVKAACEVFAEKGYKDTTVADICKKANANVASINYHFGSKETLYIEAWEYSFDECLKKYPPDGGVKESEPPEERLKGRIVSLINKIIDQDYKAFAIMQKEMAEPTGLLKDLIKERLEPIHRKMDALVKELLGPRASDEQIYFCKNSIMGQCFHLFMMKRISNLRNWKPLINFNEIKDFSEHIFKFSLAGIKAVRKENLNRNKKRK